ncbi:MAG: LAGLIDADG family homing endonuclease [Elusimicrobiota bacterium]
MGYPRDYVNRKLNNFELGWLSAAIDGEGSIGVNEKYNVIWVSISNTNKDFINYAKKLLHGNILIRPKTEKRKTLYKTEIGSKEKISCVLRQVIPFLLIKKDIAKTVLEIANRKGIYGIKKCKICNNKHYSKGFCEKHWYIKYGKKYYKSWYQLKKSKTK